MTQFDNSGSFSKNIHKENEKHADIKGKATIEGVNYWIDGWAKKREDGSNWYSLSFKKREYQSPQSGEDVDTTTVVPF